MAEKYQGKHQYESAVTPEMAEGTVIAAKALCVEKVPELQHYKCGEEKRQLMHVYHAASAMPLAPDKEHEHDGKERKSAEGSKELYHAAKAFIGFVQKMGIRKGSGEYENQF